MAFVFLQSDLWIWMLGLLPLAVFAFIRALVALKNDRLDDGLTLLGLYVAVGFIVISVMVSAGDNALATHRHNCIMYELALQRNANPDLANVVIDPAWHDLECYPAP